MACLAAGIAKGGQARFPGLIPTSTRGTMPKADSGASALASLLHGRTAGELIPEMTRNDLRQRIDLEAPAFLVVRR